jgi:hypothetical protein
MPKASETMVASNRHALVAARKPPDVDADANDRRDRFPPVERSKYAEET